MDFDHHFKIADSYPTIEIEFEGKYVSVPKYYQSKSHRRTSGLQIPLPESIYLELRPDKNKSLHIIVSKSKYPNIFGAGYHLCESVLTGPRFQKYLELYKAYESITTPTIRNIEFAAIRHSISHASRQLTKPVVTMRLNDLFGGLTIDLSKYRHRKEFFIHYWNLLIEVDHLLYNEVSALTTKGRKRVKGIYVFNSTLSQQFC